MSIAREMYDSRDFSRFSELSDELMTVGCRGVELIRYLRESKPLARGSWVVDLVLGKS